VYIILFTLTFCIFATYFAFSYVCQISTNFYIFELWILEFDVGSYIWQGLLIGLSKSCKENFLFMRSWMTLVWCTHNIRCN
jgi:hypothetical protein